MTPANMAFDSPTQQMAAMYLSMGKLTVASLYPLAVRYSRPFKSTIQGGFHTDYDIEASDGITPVIIHVGSGGQNTHVGNRQYMAVFDTAQSIARDVVRNARAVPLADGASGPAVWLCNEAEPTRAESARHLNGQVIWARRRVIQARDWHLKGNGGLITDLDRTLGNWLKLDPRSHTWMVLAERTETKPCPFCRTDIDSLAVVCPTCTNVVDARRMKALQAELESLAEESAELEQEAAAFEQSADGTAAKPKVKQNRHRYGQG